MTSPHTISDFLTLFQRVLQAPFFEPLAKEHILSTRRGIYVLPVVLWLMIYQRLWANGSLASAVLYLAEGGARQLYPPGQLDKRVLADEISVHTGGYCRARQRMPILVASQVNDHIFEQLRGLLRVTHPVLPIPVFVVDGTTLQLQHEHDLVESFPPGHNQHGENHWPVMQMVVFHDAETGLATRPNWGPKYGPQAGSEQALAKQSLTRLPADALVLADGNFGIFAFAYAVQQSQRPMLLRLTAARAKKVLGGTLCKGTHRKVVWEASVWDRNAHPDLPAAARLEGWVIVCRNPSRPQEKLYLFTTLELSVKEILDLYQLRWNVEMDLRSLKRTVALHQIHSKNVPMVEKELLLAVSAYNLVRAVMALAAHRAGLKPRDLSFSFVLEAVNIALPGLDKATTQAEYEQRMERLLHRAAQGKLPHRSRKRSYPREVWGRGGSFPRRNSNRKEQSR